MTTIYAYLGALGALTLWTIARGSEAMLRTVCTLIAVTVAAYSFALLISNDEAYAWFMIALDGTACRVITWRPAGRWQSIIGQSFLLQIALHAGRILNGSNADMNLVWDGLTLLAFVQLALVAGWWLHEKRDRHRPNRFLDTVVDQAGSSGLAR